MIREFWRAFRKAFWTSFNKARNPPLTYTIALHGTRYRVVPKQGLRPLLHEFSTSGGGHRTDGGFCWCSPERRCVVCEAITPCLHGVRRPEIIIHKQPS